MNACGCVESYPQLVPGRVSHGPGCDEYEKTPLEEAIERTMRNRNGSQDPSVLEQDASSLARVVVRHWGDDAPRVLARALELAGERVASWTPRASTAEGGG